MNSSAMRIVPVGVHATAMASSAALAPRCMAQGDMPPGTAANDMSVVPEFWLFAAAGVLSLALAVGVFFFWRAIGKAHDREVS